jgi:hypothetical protein
VGTRGTCPESLKGCPEPLWLIIGNYENQQILNVVNDDALIGGNYVIREREGRYEEHYYAHELNLVLCASCRSQPDCNDFFDTLKLLYDFFSASLKEYQSLSAARELLGISEKSELTQLSSTRWACQVRAVVAVKKNYPAVVHSLRESRHPNAIGLKKKVLSYSFVAHLFVFEALLKTSAGLHELLQGESVDLSVAVTGVAAVIDSLQNMRSEEFSASLFQEIQAFCDAAGIVQNKGRPRKQPTPLDNFVLLAQPTSSRIAADLGQEGTAAEAFRTKLFYPCLDQFLGEMSQRFSSVNTSILSAIQACSPTSGNFLEFGALQPLASHYKLELSKEEVIVAKNFLARLPAQPDMVSVYSILNADMFPSLKRLLQIVLSIPVSSCSCERSFSALRRLHSWLRGKMVFHRLDDLSILSIERNVFKRLSADMIIDRFLALSKRRQ